MHEIVIGLLALPALFGSAYLFLIAAFAWRRPPTREPDYSLRFEVVVPAHDEEATIGRTLRSLRGLAWPERGVRITVVADNCTDRTAERAAAAGARVLVRRDPTRRGKGRALEHAFRHGMADGFADAFVVVDADTEVSRNLLVAFAQRLSSGERVIQSAYGVLNPEASWRTRLMTLAFALVNDVRSLGRERLGLSCGLRGNGMCFSRETLVAVGYDAFSVVEDAEYGIQLGEAGIRVAYAAEASVLGEMVPREREARSQRRRWEGGRRSLALKRGPGLLVEALRRRKVMLLDLALDLLVPSLSSLTLYAVTVAVIAGFASAHQGAPLISLWLSLASLAFILVYVLRGWVASGLGLSAIALLPRIPVYVLWKLALLVMTPVRGPTEFVRTARVRGPDDSESARGGGRAGGGEPAAAQDEHPLSEERHAP